MPARTLCNNSALTQSQLTHDSLDIYSILHRMRHGHGAWTTAQLTLNITHFSLTKRDDVLATTSF